MYLENYQHLKNNESYKLVLIILLSILARIPIILLYGDTGLENEWKVLVNNLIDNKILAFDYLNPELDEFLIPNVWMPPLYAYYLYFFSFFNLEESSYIKLILSSQVLLSCLSVVIFYKINKIFFSQKISFYGSLIFSLFPLYLYSCAQISSIILQVFLTILFLYFVFSFVERKNFFSIFLLSFTGGLLLLLRGEFILILVISLIYLFFYFKISIKNILLILLITLLTASPYLIRNIIILDKIILTKSFGYNLWKGNNPKAIVEGGLNYDRELIEKIDKIPKDKYYGINFDNIFLYRALSNLSEDPKKYFSLFLKKFFSFMFIDINSSQKGYYNPLNYIPALILGITSLLGIFLSNKKSNKSNKFNYLILLYFVNIVIFSCFFILPRYKLVIIPFQIIFTNILLNYISKKFSKTL